MNLNKLIYGVAGVLGVVILFSYWHWLLSPMVSRFSSAYRDHAQVNSEIKQKKPLALDEAEMEAKQAHFEMTFTNLSTQIPEKSYIPDLLKDITKIATESNIYDFQFAPSQPEKVDRHAIQPIDMTVSCGYHALGYFVSELINMPRLVVPQIKTIQSDDPNNPNRSVTVKMILETYVQKNQ